MISAVSFYVLFYCEFLLLYFSASRVMAHLFVLSALVNLIAM